MRNLDKNLFYCEFCGAIFHKNFIRENRCPRCYSKKIKTKEEEG